MADTIQMSRCCGTPIESTGPWYARRSQCTECGRNVGHVPPRPLPPPAPRADQAKPSGPSKSTFRPNSVTDGRMVEPVAPPQATLDDILAELRGINRRLDSLLGPGA